MVVPVLLCYAQEDKLMTHRLKQHLSPLERNGYISIQVYDDIYPGADRGKELKKHLDEAQLILLLISASFLSSTLCYEEQMQYAIERHERDQRKKADIVPIILRDCHWKEPPLDKLQPLPEGARPISKWPSQDEGFANVADAIAKVVKQWNNYTLPGPIAERRLLMTNLDQLIEAVKTQMQPEPRALATAYTLQQVSVYTPIEVTLADLVTGWRILSRSKNEGMEAPNISQRRITCGELANIASQFTTEPGNLTRAMKTWDVWQNAFKDRTDPRQSAMAKTFARELAELQEAARLQQ